MRLKVTCEVARETAFPVNHQHHLCSLAYGLLRRSDAEFARALHDEGFGAGEDTRRYKLFCFSTLRAPKGRRRVEGETLWLRPGPVEWVVSSPLASFLMHFATGLLSAGGLRVGETTLPILEAQTAASPDFAAGTARLTCLTPVVASVPGEAGGKRYLRPHEGSDFSEAVHRNLLRKYAALHGQAHDGSEPFSLTWDVDYLARNPHGGQKKTTFKSIEVIGVQAPCTLSGSPALLELAYDTGLGELNSSGFGMVEVYEGVGCRKSQCRS